MMLFYGDLVDGSGFAWSGVMEYGAERLERMNRSSAPGGLRIVSVGQVRIPHSAMLRADPCTALSL